MICVQFHLKDVLKNASTSTAPTTTTQNAIKYVYTRQCEVIDHTSNNEGQSYTEVQKGFYKEMHSYAEYPFNVGKNFFYIKMRENTPVSNKQSNAHKHSYTKPYYDKTFN